MTGRRERMVSEFMFDLAAHRLRGVSPSRVVNGSSVWTCTCGELGRVTEGTARESHEWHVAVSLAETFRGVR